MSHEGKPPVSPTQFGALQESHSTLEGKHEELKGRFDDQDKQLRKLEAMGRLHGKQIEGQSAELQANTQATRRIETKTDDLFVAIEWVKKTCLLIEFVFRRVLPVLIGLGSLLAGWGWLTQLFKH